MVFSSTKIPFLFLHLCSHFCCQQNISEDKGSKVSDLTAETLSPMLFYPTITVACTFSSPLSQPPLPPKAGAHAVYLWLTPIPSEGLLSYSLYWNALCQHLSLDFSSSSVWVSCPYRGNLWLFKSSNLCPYHIKFPRVFNYSVPLHGLPCLGNFSYPKPVSLK